MCKTYMAVRKVEKDAERYSFASYTSPKKKKLDMSHRVMVQGILYSAVLALLCLAFILVAISSSDPSSYKIDLLCSIVLPLQGFWNALIYMKPLFEKIMKKRCKLPQNVSSSIQDNQNTSSEASCLSKSLQMFSIRKRTPQESEGSSNQQVEVHDEESKKEEDLEGCNDRVGVLKVNSKKKVQQISHVNDGSSPSKSRKSVMFKDIKGQER